MKKLVTLCLVLTGFLFAVPANAQMQGRGMGSSSDTMQGCHQGMQKLQQSNRNVKQHIVEARQSEDPAKMRSALAEAESALTAIDNHIGGCMEMMHRMNGKDDSMPAPGRSGYLHE